MKKMNPCIPWCPSLRGQKQQIDENMTVEKYLPLDIVANILARLPTELIFLCSHPCKSLRSITTSPSFVDMLLHQSIPMVAFQFYYRRESTLRYPLASVIYLVKIRIIDEMAKKIVTKSIKTDFDLALPNQRACVPFLYGSYKGILLFKNIHYAPALFLINPITQDKVTIVSKNSECFPCGLFFHPTSREFRVLFCYPQRAWYFKFIILNLGTKLSRKAAIFSHPPSNYTTPIILNGTLHWKVDFPSYKARHGVWPHCSESILFFNMDKEKFGTMAHPEQGCGWGADHTQWVGLMEMERNLCWFTSLFPDIVIWILEDYEKKVWVKRHVIDVWPIWKSLSWFRSLYYEVEAIHICGNDLLMSVGAKNLFIYNLRLGTFRRVGKGVFLDDVRAVSHINSLLSFNCKGNIISL